MKTEAQRIAIAQACGLKPERLWAYWIDREGRTGSTCISSKRDAELQRQKEIDSWQEFYGPMPAFTEPEEYDEWRNAPYYLSDLNEMHEAEKVLTYDQRRKYVSIIFNLPVSECESSMFATAAQRAEAFLRTLNLWKD